MLVIKPNITTNALGFRNAFCNTRSCCSWCQSFHVVSLIKVHRDLSKPWPCMYENASGPFDVLLELAVHHLESALAWFISFRRFSRWLKSGLDKTFRGQRFSWSKSEPRVGLEIPYRHQCQYLAVLLGLRIWKKWRDGPKRFHLWDFSFFFWKEESSLCCHTWGKH